MIRWFDYRDWIGASVMSRRLFLARGNPTPYGYSWPERGEDGPHDTPEGVARAAELLGRLGHEGPWVMVEVFPVPVQLEDKQT